MSKARRLFVKYWLPAFLWMAAIFFASSIPRQYLPEVPIPKFSYILHFIEYAILGALLIRAFLHSKFDLSMRYLSLIATAFASLYAAADEFHQSFVPGREMDVIDWLFDFLGSVAGVLVYRRRCDSARGLSPNASCGSME